MLDLNAADWITVLAGRRKVKLRLKKRRLLLAQGKNHYFLSSICTYPLAHYCFKGGWCGGGGGGYLHVMWPSSWGITTIHYICYATVLFIEQEKSQLTSSTCLSINAWTWVSLQIDISGQVGRTTLFTACQWERVIRRPYSGSSSLLSLRRCKRNCLCMSYALTE